MPTFYPPGTRKGNRSWTVAGRINGRQREATFPKARSKREARAAWDEYAADIRRGDGPKPGQTFADAVTLYEESHVRSNEQMKWARAVSRKIGHMHVAEITPGDVQGIARKLYPGRSESTLNRSVLSVAQAVINCAADNGWCRHIRIKRFKEKPVVKKHPSEMAGELMVKNTEGDLQIVCALYHYQGLRPSDALSIKWEGIDLKDRTFQVVIPKSNTLKTMAMAPDVWELIANKKDRGEYLIRWRCDKYVWRLVSNKAKELGITFGARMARHKFASDLVSQGGTSWDLVNTGSWTNERSVQPYVTLDPNRARKMLENRRKAGKNAGKVV